MTQLIIQVKNLSKVDNAFRNLPRNLQKEINKDMLGFMKMVRKSAKLRAPRFTGFLASSITIKEKGKQIILSVKAPYAVEQETGKGLPKRDSFPKYKSKTRGRRLIKSGSPSGSGSLLVRRYKPFLQPALEHNIAKLQSRLSDATKQAIKQSGFR